MFSFVTTLYDIYSSSSSKFQRRKIQENWQPLIQDLKKMAETLQGQYQQMATEKESICNRVVMLAESDEITKKRVVKDKQTIYIKGDIAYWHESDGILKPHHITPANKSALLKLISPKTAISKQDGNFEQITALCGYTREIEMKIESGKECGLRLLSQKPTEEEHKNLNANTIYLYQDGEKLKYVVKGIPEEHDIGELDKETIKIIQSLFLKKPLPKEVLYDSNKLLESKQQKALQVFFNITSKRGHTPSKFIRNIHEILEQIEKLPQSVDYELHHAANEKAAQIFLELKSSHNAIVIVQENNKQYTYIKHSSGKIVKQQTSESIELPTLTEAEPIKKVMIINEKNFIKIDKLITSVLENAGMKPPDTDWKALTKLLEKIPVLLAAFDELNLHSKLKDKLAKLKQKLDPQKVIKDLLFTGYDLALMSGMPTEPQPQTIYLSANTKGLSYTVIGEDKKPKNNIISWKDLPKGFPRTEIEIISAKNKFLPDILQQIAKAGHAPPPTLYEKITREMGDWLDEKHFKSLPPDQQAMTLSFMELYNEILKQTYLQLRETEQKMGLKRGSLANVTVLEGKSLNTLCEEFNEVYQRSMTAAGYYTISIELYPFTESLAPKSTVSTSSQPDTKVEKSEVRTITDLYAFTQKSLRERYRQLKKLKTEMSAHASQEESLAQPDKKTQEMVTKANEFLVKAEGELKKALDETVYARYFIPEAKKTKSSLDRVNEEQNNWVKLGPGWVERDKQSWIQEAGQGFIQLKNIVAQIEVLQKDALTKEGLTTPAARLAERAAKLDELAKAGIKLVTSLNQIRNDPYLRNLIAPLNQIINDPSFQNLTTVSSLTGVTNTLTTFKNLSEESILHTFKDAFKKSTASLAEKLQRIQDMLSDKLTSDGTQLDKSTLNTLMTIGKLVDQLNAKKVTGEEVNLLFFATNNFSEIRIILNELPKILGLLSHLSKGKITEAAEAINNTLEQLVLLSDKLEIQLGLKEGHLTHLLEPAIRAFNTQILELGYRFPKEKTYPYPEALVEQREKLLAEKETSPLQKELILRRTPSIQEKIIKSEEKKIKTEEKKSPEKIKVKDDPITTDKKSFNKPEINEPIIKEIEKYITKLRSLNQKELNKTIELLESLINDQVSSNLTERWKQLKVKHPDHFSLLLKGETGVLLKKLEYKAQEISQENIFNSLQRELTALKMQRGSYFMRSARLLEEKISAWESLHDLLKTHNLSDALDKLTPAQLAIVKKNEHGLLEKIQIMNSALHAEDRLTTLISSSSSKPDVPVTVPAPVLDEKIENIIKIIDTQLQKLADTERRAVLLEELKIQLKNNLSLDSAIKQLKSNNSDVHLLFQGRVGQMMKSIENVALTKETLIKRIDYELDILLNKQHTSHFIFFAKSRAAALEKQIESLEALKNELVNKKTMREAVNSLEEGTKKLLQQHQPDLLKKIDAASPNQSVTPKAS